MTSVGRTGAGCPGLVSLLHICLHFALNFSHKRNSGSHKVRTPSLVKEGLAYGVGSWGEPSGFCGPSVHLSLSQTRTRQLSSAHHDAPVTTPNSVQPVAGVGPYGVSQPMGFAHVKLGDSGHPRRGAPSFLGVRLLNLLSDPLAVLIRPLTVSESASSWDDGRGAGTGRAAP